ncbi:MAG: TonB-dependent receptor [Chitinophagaceae bacterium]
MKRRIFVVAAVTIISSRLLAQEDTTKNLDEVVLTASKYPKKQSETGKVITVINHQQLEQSGGKSLSEILNTISGTNILGANNSPGTNLSASIRGSSSGNVLILVDGMPANDPSAITNYFDLNFFAVDQIERIEILKGGQSTLYGSDAVAGVINIITKKPSGKKFGVSVGVAAGSYGTFKQNVSMSGNQNKMDYSVNYVHLNSKGFSSAYDSTGKGDFDKDGIEQHAVSGNIRFKLSNKLQWKLLGSYNYYKTGLDASAFNDEKNYNAKNTNAQGGTGLVYNHTNGSLHFNYLFNYVSRGYLDDSNYVTTPASFAKSLYVGRVHFAEVYNNWQWTNWELLAGVDYRFNNTYQRYFSTGPYGPYDPPVLNNKSTQVSPYASIVYKTNTGFNVEAGGRWNYHSVYGNNFTYTFNPSYLIHNTVKLFANLYSAYKVPTLYQLYDADAGNKDLKPEKGIIGEAGVQFLKAKGFDFRVTGFYRKTKDAIIYSFDNNTFQSLYINVAEQKNYGAEVEANYKWQKLSVTANYTYTDGKTKSSYDGTGSQLGKDTSYYNLYRIPKNAFNLTIGYQFTKSFFVSVLLHSVSKREEYIYAGAPAMLDGYTTIDLYADYKFAKRFMIFVDFRNLTDKKYFDWLGYNTKRFNFMAGINFRL